jgi:hypothetical protein
MNEEEDMVEEEIMAIKDRVQIRLVSIIIKNKI